MEVEVKPLPKGVEPVEPCGLLLVDGEHLAHRAFHAYSGQGKMNPVTSTGIPTAVVYGFLNILKRKLDELHPKMTVICWGGRREDLWRKKVYPEYKADREPNDPGFIEQVKNLWYTLPLLGLDQLVSQTEEADDLIAASVFNWERQDLGSVYILTNDHDLRSLVAPHVFVVAPNPGGIDILWDIPVVIAKYGVEPFLLPDVFSMVGDDDNIPGIKGIGIVTATKIIQEGGMVESWIDDVKRITCVNNKIRGMLETNREKVKLFKKLMVFDRSRQVTDANFITNTMDPIEAEKTFNTLEFRTIQVNDFKVGLKYEKL